MEKNSWNAIDKAAAFAFCEGYMDFLNRSKTERHCARTAVELARAAGFVPLGETERLSPGDKVFVENRGKSVLFAVMGKDGLFHGANIVASHIDSPRIDLKPNPLYEDSELALFKTHYYGGIKKYQWLALPLSLIGTVVKEDGSKVEIDIGEKDSDPVFTITDLLPHLAADQMSKKVSEAFPGEDLNVLLGSIPSEAEKDKVKEHMLYLLKERYGITEEDFVSAELSLVPNAKARSAGLDASFVGGYGQDDRVCAYTSLAGILALSSPDRTCICYLADKEEIGSMGNTGTKSMFFENCMAKLLQKSLPQMSDIHLKDALSHSVCLSADVTAGYDPTYKSVNDPLNSAYVGGGLCICKYTGARGKSSTSDASAELVAKVRGIFNQNGVKWQIGELGKVDQGGGGTVAQFLANLNIDTLDCGVPVLSMHAPFEITSKADVYSGYLGYRAFYQSK